MKKIFLFLSGVLLSLSMSAQEIYEVTVSNWDFQIGPKAENNVEIQSQLPGLLKSGDFIHLTVKGYFDQPIIGVGVTCVVDNSGATMGDDGLPNYWIQLSEWKTENLDAVTPAKTLFEQETYIELTADATSTEKIVVRMSPRTEEDVAVIKMRPTAEFKEGAKYEASLPTIPFEFDGGTNYKAEFAFETDNPLADDDIVKVTIDGVFTLDFEQLNFMIFDNAGNEVMGWSARSCEVTAGERVTKTFEFTIKLNEEKFPEHVVEGTANKIGVFVAGYDAAKPLSFLMDGDVAHDPVDLGTKEFKNLTLTATTWDGGSNYQSSDADITVPEGGFFAGDFITITISGVANQDINGLQAVLVDASGNAVSAYTPLNTEKIEKDGTVELTKKLVVSAATNVCKVRINTTDAVVEGVETIEIKTAGDIPDAVEEISASPFAVEGGMVYSAGEIVIYNVAGKEIAKASKAFNVNSLAAGVYFITAQEGTIKFVK